MIFHTNRISLKAGVSEEQRAAAYELLRRAGADNPAVKSFVAGSSFGGEFEYGAVFVIEDLDGYWEYLNHPAHVRLEMEGIELLERFEAFDITDSIDEEMGAKIAQLQVRHLAESPALAALVGEAPSFSVPDDVTPK